MNKHPGPCLCPADYPSFDRYVDRSEASTPEEAVALARTRVPGGWTDRRATTAIAFLEEGQPWKVTFHGTEVG